MDLIPFSLTGQCLESYFVRITSRSKIIYWIIISVVITAVVVLPFVYVDVSVQARGYFQSGIEKQTIYTPFHGRILYSSVHNGDYIKKGDTLLIIDSETIRAQYMALKQRINENNSSISDLEKLTLNDSSFNNIGNLRTMRYRVEYANLRNQQAIQFQKWEKKKAEHERTILLHDQQIIPDVDFENSLFNLNSEHDNLRQVSLYQQTAWHSDLMIRRNDSVKLVADLKQYDEELQNRIILAPVSGEIIQSADIQVGSIVNPGQIIAEVSPDGELIATCFVKPADIGLIHEDQDVRIQVDAFNYNEWGMLEGKIIDISDDMIVEKGSTAFFRVKCKPSRTFLALKNGHKANIKKGMSLNTRIIVIKRSLFNLLFDKADKWFNPYTYKSE